MKNHSVHVIATYALLIITAPMLSAGVASAQSVAGCPAGYTCTAAPSSGLYASVYGNPSITKEFTGVSDVITANFNISMQAIGASVLVGLPGSSYPAITRDSFIVYRNGVQDVTANYGMQVSYGAPFNVPSSGGRFALPSGQGATVPVRVSFSSNVSTASYSIKFNGINWMTTSGQTRAGTVVGYNLSTATVGGPVIVPPVATSTGVVVSAYHSADTNKDWKISDAELSRFTYLYNYRSGTMRTGDYRCFFGTTDGYDSGIGLHTCAAHSADTNRDWRISLPELLRVIEFKNSAGYKVQAGTEDGFAPMTNVVNNAKANISLNAASPLAASIPVSDVTNSRYLGLPVIVFDVNAQNDTLHLRSVTVKVYTAAGGTGSISAAYLYQGSTQVASAPVSNGSVTFSNIMNGTTGATIPVNTTVPYTIKVDVTGLSSGSISLTAGVATTTSTDMMILASDDAPATIYGSATGNRQTVNAAGPLFTLVGAPTITMTNVTPGNSTDSTFAYVATFNVNILAIGQDLLIGLPASTTPLGASFGTVSTSRNLAQLYANGIASTVPVPGGLIASYSQPSNTTLTSNTFKVVRNQSVTIPVAYSFTLTNPGPSIAVQMQGIYTNGSAYTNFMSNQPTWRTPSIGGNGGGGLSNPYTVTQPTTQSCTGYAASGPGVSSGPASFSGYNSLPWTHVTSAPTACQWTCTSGYIYAGGNVCIAPVTSPTAYHSADTNHDMRISSDEFTQFQRLYEYREGTARTGEYHSDATEIDTYGIGPGAHVGPTHSADVNMDWKISLNELARVIELKNSGTYKVQAGTEDGFASNR